MSIPILTTGYYDLDLYEPIGMISSVSVHAISIIRGFLSGITSIFGGQQTLIETKYKDIRDQSIEGLLQQAKNVGANLVVGLDVEVSSIANEFMVYVASGTALKYKKKPVGIVTNPVQGAGLKKIKDKPKDKKDILKNKKDIQKIVKEKKSSKKTKK
jgi:uncharacterized protein YbjQ (UPF0145 family)